MRRLQLVSVALAMAFAASACDYSSIIDALTGTPVLSECDGQRATIGIGWVPDDGSGATYDGTEGDDVVVITNGPVTFNGLGGNDLICVNRTGFAWGPGLLSIYAGPGDDTVHNFTDGSVFAALGDDDDTYHGADGRDFVGGEAGNDVINTGAGEDNVTGGSGDDHITTGEGDDVVSGGTDNDIIDSGPGNDEVHSGPDADVVDAGPGDDDVHAADHVDEVVDCGEGDEVTGDFLEDFGFGPGISCENVYPAGS